jgi:cytochrome P450
VTGGYDPLAAGAGGPEVYAALRRDCPVHHHPVPDSEQERQAANPRLSGPTAEFWSLLRHADCVDVLQHPERFSSVQGPGPERRAPIGAGMLLTADDPAHRRQRRIANKGFLPRVVRAQEEAIQACMDDLVAAVAPHGRCDVVEDLAIPLTVTMVTEMFGAGSERRSDVARWGKAIIGANGGDAAAVAAAAAALDELSGYILTLAGQRRGGEGTDVLSALVNAVDEEGGFTDDEICTAAAQFLSAGFETTATAIGNAIVLLCGHPEQRAALEADWSRLDACVEEMLRLEPPVEGLFRTAAGSQTVGGQDVPADAKVRMVFASANRDPERFTDPDAFRLDRPAAELRQHLAFGHGTHACIGSALARTELRIALRTILTRLPGLRLDPARPPVRTTSWTVNGWASVPIVW